MVDLGFFFGRIVVFRNRLTTKRGRINHAHTQREGARFSTLGGDARARAAEASANGRRSDGHVASERSVRLLRPRDG